MSNKLKDVIEKVRRADLPVSYITRADGLREKVKELLNKGGKV